MLHFEEQVPWEKAGTLTLEANGPACSHCSGSYKGNQAWCVQWLMAILAAASLSSAQQLVLAKSRTRLG